MQSQPDSDLPAGKASGDVKHELREWLGVAPADFLIYAALLLGGSLYFLSSRPVEIAVSVIAVGLGLVSCYFGMRHDDRVSQLMNVIKKVSYPLCVLLLTVIIFLNFTRWSVR